MSEPLKIGLVAEGPTDYEVIQAALKLVGSGHSRRSHPLLSPSSIFRDLVGRSRPLVQ